jgi:hypothetical protein
MILLLFLGFEFLPGAATAIFLGLVVVAILEVAVLPGGCNISAAALTQQQRNKVITFANIGFITFASVCYSNNSMSNFMT